MPFLCSGPRAPMPAAGTGNVKAVRAQLELADQDCTRISGPDYSTSFQSLEDAVDRLLPFHVRPLLGLPIPTQCCSGSSRHRQFSLH